MKARNVIIGFLKNMLSTKKKTNNGLRSKYWSVGFDFNELEIDWFLWYEETNPLQDR